MPKRKFTNKKIKHQQKLKMLQRISSSSSSNEETESADFLESETKLTVPEDMAQPHHSIGNGTVQEIAPVEQPAATAADAPSNATAAPAQQENPVLGPELLNALGDATDESPKFRDKNNSNLASHCLPLVRKSYLSKKAKEKLLKQYPIPENCKFLQAPKLNPEIAAIITEEARNRDKELEIAQQQLGVGITAIGRAMTILLNGDDKVKAMKALSDSYRILSDLHYRETHHIQDTEDDI